jgi:hypothetical protein
MIVSKETLPKTEKDLLMKNKAGWLQSHKIKHQQSYRKQIKTHNKSGASVVAEEGGERRQWQVEAKASMRVARKGDPLSGACRPCSGGRKVDGDTIGVGGGRRGTRWGRTCQARAAGGE